MQQIYSDNLLPIIRVTCEIRYVLRILSNAQGRPNSPLQNVMHNEYYVQQEVSFLFAYAAFAFWSWLRFNEFFKFKQ